MTVPWQIAINTGQVLKAFPDRSSLCRHSKKTIDQCSADPAQKLRTKTLDVDDSARPQRINPKRNPKLSRYNRFLTNYTQRGRLFDRLEKRSWHMCLRSTVAKFYPLQLTPKTFSRSSLVTLGTRWFRLQH